MSDVLTWGQLVARMKHPPDNWGVTEFRTFLQEAAEEFIRLGNMAALDQAAYEEIRQELMRKR
jgi:hypothetical protein